MLQRVILGPQRPTANLAGVLEKTGIPDGPIAVISAGWQEAEGDTEDLHQLLDRPLVDLSLYQRAEKIFAADKKLRTAYRQRQDRLQELQKLYRQRLQQLMIAARKMHRAKAPSDLLEAEQLHAVVQVQSLDEHHMRRHQSISDEYAEAVSADRSGLLADHVGAIERAIAGCSTVLLTGGNVLVLLNRLHLFHMHELLASRNLIAWSAGAMVLSDLIVLFHDKTPTGRREAEILGSGMGIVPGYVFLPDATRRLLVKDRVRLGLFSQRFAPAKCLTLNNGSLIHFQQDKISRAESVGCLTFAGVNQELSPS